MTEAAIAPLERARKLANFANGLALVALIGIVVVIAVRDIALPLLLNLSEMAQPGSEATVVRLVLSQFAAILPNMLLIWALQELRVVLGEYAAGRFFTHRAAAGVRKTGEALLWAVAVSATGTPTLLFYLGARDELGMDLSTFDLALAAIGLFVMLMGRVLEAAAAIKADSDQIV